MARRKQHEIVRQQAAINRVATERMRFRNEVMSQSCPGCGQHTASRIDYRQAEAAVKYNLDIDSDLIFDVGSPYKNGDPQWVCRNCSMTWGERDESRISWAAGYSSGFSETLFGYELACEDGVAVLMAHWSWPEPSTRCYRVRFAIDDLAVRTAMNGLRNLSGLYQSYMDDSARWHLTVTIGGESFRTTVEQGALMDRQIPEAQPLLDVFAWLHEKAIDQLPVSVRSVVIK